jgi:hypothetical protein
MVSLTEKLHGTNEIMIIHPNTTHNLLVKIIIYTTNKRANLYCYKDTQQNGHIPIITVRLGQLIVI